MGTGKIGWLALFAVLAMAAAGLYAYATRQKPSSSTSNSASADAREAAAALRRYAQAQAEFLRKNAGGSEKAGYARELSALRGQLPDDMLAAWGSSGKPWHGYLFREVRTIGHVPVDWTVDYALSAAPAPGFSGRTLLIATGGAPLGAEQPAQSGFVEDFPVDPAKAGWKPEP